MTTYFKHGITNITDLFPYMRVRRALTSLPQPRTPEVNAMIDEVDRKVAAFCARKGIYEHTAWAEYDRQPSK